ARSSGNKSFESLITEHAKRLYNQDENCALYFEPSGHDFLSPCLEEAYLMSKVLPRDDYRKWLKGFLPDIFAEDFTMIPAKVSDRTDGHLVHLDGLNFSRTACLFGIAEQLPELNHLNDLAWEHFSTSLGNISDDDYMGSHWLGTFALYALQHQPSQRKNSKATSINVAFSLLYSSVMMSIAWAVSSTDKSAWRGVSGNSFLKIWYKKSMSERAGFPVVL